MAEKTINEQLAEQVGAGDSKIVAAIFGTLTDENTDRKAFYALTAEKFETTPEIVARSAGIRNFKAAEPEHWLKLKDGTWVQKKNLEEVRKREDEKEQKG